MRKLKLAFDELYVESFTISRGKESRGTAYAHGDTMYVANPFGDTTIEADTTLDADTTIEADTTIDGGDTTIDGGDTTIR
jgi:hypothetical protein